MGRWQSEALPASVALSPTTGNGLDDDAGVSGDQHEIRSRIAPDMAGRCWGQSIADRIDDDIMAHRQGEGATDDPNAMRMSGRDGVIAVAGREIMAMARPVIMDKSGVAAPPAGTAAIDDGVRVADHGIGRPHRRRAMVDDAPVMAAMADRNLRIGGRGADGEDHDHRDGGAGSGGGQAKERRLGGSEERHNRLR